MKSDLPLVCDMNVFAPSQREKHIQITTQLLQGVQSVQELDRGYGFTFPNETMFVINIADFIANERLCCPFLEFILSVNPGNEPISLSLTGPEGTREFLRAELDGAFR
ncbi:MAG TPA: hypothetical protein VJ785_05065 [Anaerolineales bacterium]|nr:hypothetical protein [Anaerolineales bacterium]